MTQVTYYVASSLDGFIATSNGGVDWLSCVEVEGEDYGYAQFIETVDGLLMGRTTFDQVQSFGEWPYGEMPCWVWTRSAIRSLLPSVSVTSEEPSAFLSAAQEWGLVHLWLVGGGILAAAFQAQHLISKYVISFIPVVLGNGISLFHGQGIIEELVLQKSRSFASGLVQSTYVPK